MSERSVVWASRLIQPIGSSFRLDPSSPSAAKSLVHAVLCYDRVDCLERIGHHDGATTLHRRGLGRGAFLEDTGWSSLVLELVDAGVIAPRWPERGQRQEAFEEAIRETVVWAESNSAELHHRREHVLPFDETEFAYVAVDKVDEPDSFVAALRGAGAEAAVTRCPPTLRRAGPTSRASAWPAQAIRADALVCKKLMLEVAKTIATESGGDVLLAENEFAASVADGGGDRSMLGVQLAALTMTSLRLSPDGIPSAEALLQARDSCRPDLDRFSAEVDRRAQESAHALKAVTEGEVDPLSISEAARRIADELREEAAVVRARLQDTGIKARLQGLGPRNRSGGCWD